MTPDPALPNLATLPGCLFARDASGTLRHVSEVETGTKGLFCPDCDGGLLAKKGAVRRPHFAHASGAECQHAGETALHLLAKAIISEGAPLHLPA